MGSIVQIFTAPKRGAPMVARDSVAAMMNNGLDGDRYAVPANRRGEEYQLTLIEMEHIEAYRNEIDSEFTAELPRRNIVTRDVRLNELCGARIQIGEVLCEGIELCEPCSLFARRTRRAVLKFFLHRGGLRARILTNGQIRVGDTVRRAS